MSRQYSNHERENRYSDNDKIFESINAGRFYDNGVKVQKNPVVANSNRFSYHRNDEPALNIKIQLNKNSVKDLNNERYYNNYNNESYIHNKNEFMETKVIKSNYMENTVTNTDSIYDKNKSKVQNLQTKTKTIKVREAFVEPEEEQIVVKNKKGIDRKVVSFNNAEGEISKKISKRSLSTLDSRKNNKPKATNHGSSSEDSSGSESEEEVISKLINANQIKSNSKKQQAVLREEEEDEEESTMKIFPTHDTKKQTKDDRNQNFLLKDMYDLLKNRANTLDFVMKKSPQNATIKTRIRRTKRKLSTQYTMFVEMPDGYEIPLMQSKRKRASTRVYVSINALELIDSELSDPNEIEQYLQIPCGKLKSRNKLKVIFDNFSLVNNAKKLGSIGKGLNFLGRKSSKKIQIDTCNDSYSDVFKEFLRIDFENSILKLTQPLKFTVSLVNNNEKGQNKLLEFQKLITKTPTFDKDKQKYILDFSSRVTHASVNNFQVIFANPDYQDTVILQSGKCKTNEYICDYSYPLSAFEAFGIILSSFNRRIV